MKSFDLLIFDWDGTLADSAGAIVATTQAAIADLGLPPRADGQIAELIGLGLADGMARLYPELDTEGVLALLAGYRRRAPAMAHVAPLFPGAEPALQALYAAGYRLAVATGKSRIGLDRALATHHTLRSLLEITRCADESADKPDPLMLRQILEVSGVPAQRALMVGDTEYDVAMASAAGVSALGVSSGVHAPERLQRAGACAVIDDVNTLPGWLDES